MVKITGPLHSDHASKQLGKNVIFKTYGNRHFVTNYNKPASVKPFTPSPNQYNQRMLYNLIIARWQTLTDNQKAVYNDETREKGLQMSGWNYFLREALKDLPTYLGLQGYWAFNQIVNGKYQDLSGNANHGTPKPSYPSNYPRMVDSINKKFGKAASFDGIDDRVNCGYSSDFDSINLTISLWFNPLDISTTRGLFDKRSGNTGYYVFIDNNNLYIRFFNSVGSRIDKHFIISTGWNHLIIIVNNTHYEPFLNNVSQGSIVKEGYAPSPGTPFTIGWIGDKYFNGFIDEVRIYNRVLSEEEIKKHYKLIR